METFWTQTSDIEARIDAEFYRLEFVEAERCLRGSASSRPLSELWKEYNRIYIGIAGFNEIPDNDLYTHYLRPADIGPYGEIDYDHLPYCKQYWLKEHGKKGCARPGDLVVEVKGNTRKVAVINERIPDNCIVSGSSYRIVLKNDMDPHFVQAYLLSSTGQLLKRRLTSNTTIQYIDPESFRGMLIPTYSSGVQKAIGNKVRKAERLRELVGSSQKECLHRISELYGDIPHANDSQTTWVGLQDLNEGRLDAWFHKPFYLNLAHCFEKRQDLCPVHHLCSTVKMRVDFSKWPASYFDYFEIAGIDPETGKCNSQKIHIAEAPSRATTIVQCGDVLISTVRPNLKAIGQVSLSREDQGIASSGFCVLRGVTAATGAYVRACLVHDVGTDQLMRWNSGGTYPAIDQSVPLNVLIPNPGEDEIARMGVELLDASSMLEESIHLIENAMMDVEALIEMTVNEEEIIMEGNAIEAWLENNPSPIAGERYQI